MTQYQRQMEGKTSVQNRTDARAQFNVETHTHQSVAHTHTVKGSMQSS